MGNFYLAGFHRSIQVADRRSIQVDCRLAPSLSNVFWLDIQVILPGWPPLFQSSPPFCQSPPFSEISWINLILNSKINVAYVRSWSHRHSLALSRTFVRHSLVSSRTFGRHNHLVVLQINVCTLKLQNFRLTILGLRVVGWSWVIVGLWLA
jgi:hypothetical protein